jgi:hypothetical protein
MERSGEIQGKIISLEFLTINYKHIGTNVHIHPVKINLFYLPVAQDRHTAFE